MERLDYQEWKNRHRQTLESFPGKSVMMFFSGGRDSSVVLHFLQQAGTEFGFSFDVRAGVSPRIMFTRRTFAIKSIDTGKTAASPSTGMRSASRTTGSRPRWRKGRAPA